MKTVWVMTIGEFTVGVFDSKARALNEFAGIKEQYTNYKTIRVDETNTYVSIKFSYTSYGNPWHDYCNIIQYEINKNTL